MDEFTAESGGHSTGDRQWSDRDRGAVYLAEDQVARVMAAPRRAVRVRGSVLVLPEPLTFGGLPAVARFVTAAVSDARTLAAYPGLGPVEVVARRGFRKATYTPAHPGTLARISIPAVDRRGRWALAQAVVLHELAHHLSAGEGHASSFRTALLHLYRVHLGQAAADLLAELFEPLELLPPLPPAQPDPALRRVGALLAKAAATTSNEEAQAFLAKATALANKHSIDLAVAALTSPVLVGAKGEPTHRMLTIGRPGATVNKLLVSLYVRLANDLGVKVDIGPRSTYVLSYGLPGDLDRLEAIYVTASQVMQSGAADHVADGSWRSQQYVNLDSLGRPESRPVTATVARNAYYIGFIERVTARPPTSQAAGRDGGSRQAAGHGKEEVAVALRHKDLVVSQYHRATTRARGSWRGSGSAAASAAGSRRAGQQAGDAFGRSRIATAGHRAIGGG